MKHYKLTRDFKPVYVLVDRRVPCPHKAIDYLVIGGMIDTSNSIQVETLADVHVISIRSDASLTELNDTEVKTTILPLALNTWLKFCEENKDKEAFIIPSQMIQTRKMIQSILKLDDAALVAFMKNLLSAL
jgi:hypothetical protein